MTYIWQLTNWTNFKYDKEAIYHCLLRCRKKQGFLKGQLSVLGLDDQTSARSYALTEEAMQTSAIEGVKLDVDSVRSSVARHLGIANHNEQKEDRQVDGLIEMLMDATDRHDQPLNQAKLFSWHAALFPTGYSGLHKIDVAKWRKAPVYVVSGYMGKEKIHYQAPPANELVKEMKVFLKWWKTDSFSLDGIVRAAIAHLHFVMIHPFDDGNGRIARAITDMALAQDDEESKKFYSVSHEIIKNKKQYYELLDKIGKGSLDITQWLEWFVSIVTEAMCKASKSINAIVTKIQFWQKNEKVELNYRQRKVLNRMLFEEPEGFQGDLTNKKYVAIAKTSSATALREMNDLMQKGLILKNKSKGRSVSYQLKLA